MQGETIRALFARYGFIEITTVFDLAGLPRISSAKRPHATH